MTLATRCPSCGTVFRVVQDQLRVSQGWVRCGRCSEAFNALESMVDVPTALAPEPHPDLIESVAPTDFRPTAVMEWPDRPAATAAPPVDPDPPLDLPPGLQLVASDGALNPATIAPGVERAEPAFDVGAGDAAAAHPAPVQADVVTLPPDPATTASPPPASVAGTAAVADPGPPPTEPAAPSFLVQAERAERWRRPAVRRSLLLLAVVGAVGLAAQVTHAFRDRIAASMPALRPALLQACAALGCRVGEFRQIESLSVESSGLVRVEGSPVYRLSVTLRNRAAVDVAAPALDLALTDAQGRPIARRVLQMSDLYLPLRTLKPGSELPIQVPLGIADRPVAGYTVEIFYP